MNAPRTMVLINPAAGGGRAGRRWEMIRSLASRQFSFDEHRTREPGEATRVAAQAARDGVERMLVVGGDGTLHEVVNGLAGTAVRVAPMPFGTGNDFARGVGMKIGPSDLLEGLARDGERFVDLGQVHGRYYLNVAGVGFDAEVARIVNAMPTKAGGTLPYLMTAVREAFRFQPSELSVCMDGAARPPGRQLMVAVGNGSAYGGGMQVCPGAEVDDGLLDVLLVGDLRGAAILRLLPRVFRGKHLGCAGVELHRAARVEIDGPAQAVLHADGELLGGLPAVFTVAHRALRLWIPG